MITVFISLFISFLSLVLGYEEADLVFVGDAMQHQAQLDAARMPDKTYSYKGYFDDIKTIVETADYAVVNLETPVGPPPHTGYPCFNAPSEFVDALADTGFDLFLTANNHTLDRSHKGLRSTISVLDERGLAHLGTYSDSDARSQALPRIVDVKGFKIAFLNYTYGTNGIEPRDGVVVDYINRPLIKNDVENARSAGAELVCVCIHWGTEYKLLPDAAQKNTADFLEALGVDMIIGAHPHVIQPMEFRANKYYPEKQLFLVYSLGNFVSNMKTHDTRGGAMAHVKLFRGEDGKPVLKSADYRLLFTVPGTSPAKNFHVTTADSVSAPSWIGRAAEFSRRAREIFNKYNINVPETKGHMQE